MSNLIQNIIASHENINLREFTNLLRQSQKHYLLRDDILTIFYQYYSINGEDKNLSRNSNLSKLIYSTQEVILDKESLYFVIRCQIAAQEAYRLWSDMTVEAINSEELSNLRGKLGVSDSSQDGEVLEIDFQSFYDYSSSLSGSKKIGNRVDSLSRYLSSKLFDEHSSSWQETLFNFLRQHKYNGQQLLINERIKNKLQLSEKVKRVLDLLDKYPSHTSYENFRFELRSFGFEPGWGNTASRAQETLSLLEQLIDCADHQVLSNFLSRIPMGFKVLVTSEDVLGQTDTDKQAVYILDGVKELEKQIQENAKLGGLDVLGAIKPKIIVLTGLIPNGKGANCNQRLEKIDDTNNCWILRVPSHKSQLSTAKNEISRFDIYPYLESVTTDSEQELLAEFQRN
ncbi:hypothetical protein IQ247_09460 [Plectonema cf. radiosum LEGE 06105]|uniref:Sucrose synthase n=1 Tax=Plectonema cf. radiosum LEGE 06105 TaxID=945769 RepID=A0A8J7F7E8_9CYAN|nr:hypothetical protein [Plectonema radiosum]MBE9212914.1 hypothetical protein [Plectonema cf. radiosum LEGE 06105]